MKIFKIITRFSVLLLASIFIIGVATLGLAFKFEYYGPLEWVMLTCWIIIMAYISVVGFKNITKE